jgi:Endonuclease/Exonuclease/phosphatase family
MLHRVVWWNTGLCPKKRGIPEPSEEQVERVATSLGRLLATMEVHAVVLGETTLAVGARIRERLWERHPFEIASSTDRNHADLKINVLFRREYLAVLPGRVGTAQKARRRVIVGWRLQVFSRVEPLEPLLLYAVHWPSRAFDHDGSKRRIAAQDLCRDIDWEIRRNPSCPVAVIGDFNDEPFDVSLASDLLAVRERMRVVEGRALLYNPFWRHLGESHPNDGIDAVPGAGSYFFKREKSWHTFDQVMVSKGLLASSSWTLVESGSGIVVDFDHLREKFDHRPIFVTFSRGTEDQDGLQEKS